MVKQCTYLVKVVVCDVCFGAVFSVIVFVSHYDVSLFVFGQGVRFTEGIFCAGVLERVVVVDGVGGADFRFDFCDVYGVGYSFACVCVSKHESIIVEVINKSFPQPWDVIIGSVGTVTGEVL